MSENINETSQMNKLNFYWDKDPGTDDNYIYIEKSDNISDDSLSFLTTEYHLKYNYSDENNESASTITTDENNNSFPKGVEVKMRLKNPSFWEGDIATGFARGTGTKADPYIIETPEQLAYLAQSVNSGNSYYGRYIKLQNDIVLNDEKFTYDSFNGRVQVTDGINTAYLGIGKKDTKYERGKWYDYEGKSTTYSGTLNTWIPIGNTSNTPFYGTFDGGNYKIKGIYTDNEKAHNVGLFGICYGTILNTHVENSYIIGLQYIGAICGVIDNRVHRVVDVNSLSSTECFICGSHDVGGLIGYYYAMSLLNINNCYTKDNVLTGFYEYSNLVGYIYKSGIYENMITTFTNCYTSNCYIFHNTSANSGTGKRDMFACHGSTIHTNYINSFHNNINDNNNDSELNIYNIPEWSSTLIKVDLWPSYLWDFQNVEEGGLPVRRHPHIEQNKIHFIKTDAQAELLFKDSNSISCTIRKNGNDLSLPPASVVVSPENEYIIFTQPYLSNPAPAYIMEDSSSVFFRLKPLWQGLEEASWSQISALSKLFVEAKNDEQKLAKLKKQYQVDIGSTKTITLGDTAETQITLVIIDFNHDKDASGNLRGITFGLKSYWKEGSEYKSYPLNSSNSTDAASWEINTTLNETIYNKLPMNLKNVIKPIQKVIQNSSSSRININNQKLFLLSPKELGISSSYYDTATENFLYPYFNNNNKTKYTYATWVRSLYKQQAYGVYCHPSNNSLSTYNMNRNLYLLFGFCV